MSQKPVLQPEPAPNPPSPPPAQKNTAGRIMGGLFLIAFAVIGGMANINQPSTSAGVNRLLEQSSGSLDNTVTISMMAVFIVLGLALIIKPPRNTKPPETHT